MSAHQEYGQDNQAKPVDAGQDIQNEERVQEQAAAQDAQGGESLDAVSALQARLQELEARQAEFQDHMLRAKAEAENTRRRAQEDVAKARKFGIESFAESLVPVKDSLEAALSQPDQDVKAWQSGVEATLRQLVTAFERHQLAEIAPQAGDKFDPHHHQAISTVPAEQPSNTVVMTLQKGYLIADRVLRPALVTVAA
jgi:molecular chaperone GrpE